MLLTARRITEESINFMSSYRRTFVPGGTFVFTVVTFDRRPILTTDLSRQALRRAWKAVQEKHPFKCAAICLLPEHFHCMWALPEDDTDYPVRWAAIKALFSKYYLQAGGGEGNRSTSRQRIGEAAIWQRRYWEHCIRDEQNYARHFDYIHYNPVKSCQRQMRSGAHNLVKNVSEWKWSSFHRYKGKGFYPEGWGENEALVLSIAGEFGE